jgi:phosphatidylglycerophosphate synthase
VAAEGPALVVTDDPSARRAERLLWASLTSSSDGWVDRHFNRPVGRPLSRWLIHTPISPNQVTLLSLLLGFVAAWFFARGDGAGQVLGALLFQGSAILDCIDGDVARLLFKESRFGKWLDLGGDQVVHIALFGAIAVGLARSGSPAPVLALAVCAIVGALLSFGVVVRGTLRPGGDPRFRRWIEAAATRDFSVVLLGLALAGRLDWFMWLAAIGSHVFWLAALGLQVLGRRPARAPRPWP